MKRIGLVTWMGTGNYGTSLQAFALHKFLEKNGYVVSITDSFPTTRGVKSYIKLLLYFTGILFIKEKFVQRKETVKQKKVRQFIKRHLNIPQLITASQRKRYIKETDVFITGSDQIWNTYYKFDPFMFLSFADGKPKIAYASSIGTSKVKEEHCEDVKRFLLDFRYIGVREDDAVKELSRLTGRNDIIKVVDPTFLLTSTVWRSYCDTVIKEIQLPSRYIFCYLIGTNQSYEANLKDVQRRTGIDNIIIVSSEENSDFSTEGAIVYNTADPLEFVQLIDKSAFVCTDSFHATALSINLNKPFVEFIRFADGSLESQNSRVFNLLDRYNLRGRVYNQQVDAWVQPIEYKNVNKLLDEDRLKSKSYLINAINDKRWQ